MFQNIINHFQILEHRPVERMYFLVGGMLFFWIVEGTIPLTQMNYEKTKSLTSLLYAQRSGICEGR